MNYSEERNEISTNPPTDSKNNRRVKINSDNEVIPYGQNMLNIINNASPFEVAKDHILSKNSNANVKGSKELKEYLITIVKAEQEIETSKRELAQNKSMNLSEVFNSYFNLQGNDYLLIEDLKAGFKNLSLKKELLKQDNLIAIMRRYSSLKKFEDSKNPSSEDLLFAMTFNEFLNMLTSFDPKYKEMVINRTPHANKAKENLIKLNQNKKNKNMRSNSLVTDLEIDLFKFFEKLIQSLISINLKWNEIKKAAFKSKISLPQTLMELWEIGENNGVNWISLEQISALIEDEVIYKKKKSEKEAKLPVKSWLELFVNYKDYNDLAQKDMIPIEFLIEALDLE